MPIFKTKKNRNSRDAPVSGYCFITGGDEVILPGYTSLAKNEQVLLCVHVIADLVSSMTLHLMQNGEHGDIRVKNELSRKLDIEPFDATTRKTFIYRLVSDMCKYGNAYCLPEISDNGYYLNFVPLPNRDCTLVNKTLTSYQLMYGGKIFNTDDIIHVPLCPNERYPYMGDGFAPMLKKTVENIAQANATKSAFLKSKWKPSLIISINSDDESLTTAEKRNKILNSYTKTTEAGEPWLIPAGELAVKTVQPLTLNDLAIQDSLQLDIKSVASVFGIPPFLLGIGEFKKDEYNNFISRRIMPIAMAIQQEFTRKILWSDQYYFRFNPKSLMQYDLGELVTFVKETIGGGILTRNEGRNELGYSPSDNEGMNDFIVLENYVPVAKVGEQKKLIQGGEKTE